MTSCRQRYCPLPADIRLGDLELCAKHYRSEVEA